MSGGIGVGVMGRVSRRRGRKGWVGGVGGDILLGVAGTVCMVGVGSYSNRHHKAVLYYTIGWIDCLYRKSTCYM